MSILKDIYYDKYSPEARQKNTPDSLCRKRSAFFNAVDEAMGREFLEHHSRGLAEWEQYQNYASFREGVRLGVLLMMEVL